MNDPNYLEYVRVTAKRQPVGQIWNLYQFWLREAQRQVSFTEYIKREYNAQVDRNIAEFVVAESNDPEVVGRSEALGLETSAAVSAALGWKLSGKQKEAIIRARKEEIARNKPIYTVVEYNNYWRTPEFPWPMPRYIPNVNFPLRYPKETPWKKGNVYDFPLPFIRTLPAPKTQPVPSPLTDPFPIPAPLRPPRS